MAKTLKEILDHPYAAPLMEPLTAIEASGQKAIEPFVECRKDYREERKAYGLRFSPWLYMDKIDSFFDDNTVFGVGSVIIHAGFALSYGFGWGLVTQTLGPAATLLAVASGVLGGFICGKIAAPFLMEGAFAAFGAVKGCFTTALPGFGRGCGMAREYRKDPQGYMAKVQAAALAASLPAAAPVQTAENTSDEDILDLKALEDSDPEKRQKILEALQQKFSGDFAVLTEKKRVADASENMALANAVELSDVIKLNKKPVAAF